MGGWTLFGTHANCNAWFCCPVRKDPSNSVFQACAMCWPHCTQAPWNCRVWGHFGQERLRQQIPMLLWSPAGPADFRRHWAVQGLYYLDNVAPSTNSTLIVSCRRGSDAPLFPILPRRLVLALASICRGDVTNACNVQTHYGQQQGASSRSLDLTTRDGSCQAKPDGETPFCFQVAIAHRL